MPDIKLIAMDLDGTLLDSQKRLSEENRTALERAAAAGIEIVPTTGRFYGGMPEVVRALPFLRYAITINGAQVYDIQNDSVIARTEIPLNQALELMEYLDELPVIYDCYQDNWGWMTEALQMKCADFTDDPHYVKMIRELRTPVPELKAHLRGKGADVQKVQFFLKDMELRDRLLNTLSERFPELLATSSLSNNVEVNHIRANKGEALMKLANHLSLKREQIMAIGDGLNDLTMLHAAGLGVAMSNACPEALDIADDITVDNDHDGVAHAIQKYC